MDKYKQFLIINKQLIKSVGELRTELISATEKERMDAIAWSKKNIFPLQRKVFKKNHEKYSSSFFGNLQESYGKTCMAYAHFLVKKDLIDKAEQGKISLGELEKLVEIKKEEQASFPLLSFFKKAHDCESFNGSVRKHPLS